MDTIAAMRVVRAVAELQSFTGAAKRLGISVQSASKAVGQLEARLGVQLFDRTTRSVTPTATGLAYAERSAELLEDFDELESVARAEHGRPSGRIRITAPTSFGERHLVPVLGEFMAEYSGVSVDLELTDRKVALVEEGFDLAIRIGELTDSTLMARRLAPMRVVVCASPEHLERHGRPGHPQELAERPCLIDLNFRSDRNWPFLIDGERVRVPVSGPFQANTPEATRRMALAGIGIGLCPMYVVGRDVVAGRLEVLFEAYEAFEFGVYAVYPYRRHLAGRVRALVDHLGQRLRQL